MKRTFFKAAIRIFAFAALIALGLLIFEYFTGYEIHRDVRYGDGDMNVMDIFIPKDAYERGESGCVMFIHGGSWSGGDKAEEAARCRLLASRGYIAVTVNYTLWSEDNADEYNVSLVLNELDLALETVKDFAAERGIIIERAATSGYSAGAHLSMLYSFSRGAEAPMEIVFTSNMAGPADISPEVWGEDMTVRVAKRLTGIDIAPEALKSGEYDTLLDSVSPVTFIDANTPPTIVMHGGKDKTVPVENAESLINKLEEYSVLHDYVYLKNSDHSLMQNPLKHFTYYGTLLDYCERYFKS